MGAWNAVDMRFEEFGRSWDMSIRWRSSTWICALTLFESASGQRMTVEAVHRDSSGAVVKLEREYQFDDGSAPLFVTVYSDGARALRRTYEHQGDTLVERNECYELGLFPGWWMKIRDLESTGLSSGDDSTHYHWYSMDYSDGVFDTVIAASAVQRFETLLDRLRNKVAEAVHMGDLSIDPRELELLESWTWRSIGERLLDMTVMNGKGVAHSHQYFQYGDSSFVARAYFADDTAAYAIDSLQWNWTCTHYVAKQYWTDDPVKYESSATVLNDRTTYVEGSDTVWCEWRYYNTPWNVLLRVASLREGGLCSSEVMNNREALREEERTSDGYFGWNENTHDERGRISKIRKFSSGRVWKTIEYSYP